MSFTSTNRIKKYKQNPELVTNDIASAIDELQAGSASWDVVTGTSQQAVVNGSYITNNGSLVTVTLPATAAVGSVVRVAGLGAGGWKIAQNAGQTINKSGSATTAGTGGHLDSANRYNAVTLLCVTANTTWNVIASEGSPTLT